MTLIAKAALGGQAREDAERGIRCSLTIVQRQRVKQDVQRTPIGAHLMNKSGVKEMPQRGCIKSPNVTAKLPIGMSAALSEIAKALALRPHQ